MLGAMARPADNCKDQLTNIARHAMLERGLLPDFSPDVIAQTRSINHAATSSEVDVRDLRQLLWASIDNDDSLDLDQLSVAEDLPGGSTRLLVAVADVDAVVKRDSPVDGHAKANTTSVYTAARIFPMLPEKLSTDLTSLADREERLAIVIEMEVDEEGSVRKSAIYRALVANRAKLAYNSVAAWLDGTAPAPAPIAKVPGLDENLRLQDRVAHTMRLRRHQHGALTLETIEARPVFINNDLTDLRADRKNRATELIEDFMIAANGVSARFLETRGYPALRRVLRSPERWARIVDLAKDSHEHLPVQPDCRALHEFLEKRRDADPQHFPDLSLSVVKLLGRGEYVLDLPGRSVEGHFGLAVRDYTHSTAPNRRFPDLLTQRLLKAALSTTPPPYTDEELSTLARHCTAQEDNATKVERQVRKSAAALLLESRVGERFEGIVTGASEKGTWVRINHPATEGRVVRGYKGLDVGQRISVVLVHTDVERGFIDFARTDRA